MISTNEIVKTAVAAMEEKKGENIRIIDISKISIVADFFLIVSGSNINQTEAIANEIENRLAEKNVYTKNKEGHKKSGWILLDYRDVVIHIFEHEDRAFYNLERIWADGKIIDDINQL